MWPITSGKCTTEDDQNQSSFVGSHCAFLGGPYVFTGAGRGHTGKKHLIAQ